MKIGILIIGSLWWRKGVRETWRNARLNVADAVSVKVPIHYGRLSSSNTYTMTFSPDGADGTALVVPCLNDGDSNGLFREAEELWGAEANHARVAKKISTIWGCVGVRFKPEGMAVETASWEGFYCGCGGKALASVTAAGLLQIPWPQRVDALPLDFDVLLATSNVESPSNTAENIAAAWMQHGREEYYFENVAAGIRTPADGAIWKKMASAPVWANSRDPRFAHVIDRLRGEFPVEGTADAADRA